METGRHLQLVQKAEDLTIKTDLNPFQRAPQTSFKIRQLLRGVKTDIVFPYLAGIDGKGVDTSRIKEAALGRARELNAQYNIFTDRRLGQRGIADKGAGLVVSY